MKNTKAIMKRPCKKGTIEYRLICEEYEDGRESFGVEVEQTTPQGDTICEAAPNVTSDYETAICLMFYLFTESVEVCHLIDIVEEMLPLETEMPECFRALAGQMRKSAQNIA